MDPPLLFFIVRCCSTDSAATTAGRPADRNRRSSAFTSTSTSDREAIRSIHINKNVDIDQLTPPCSSDSPGSVIKMFLRI